MKQMLRRLSRVLRRSKTMTTDGYLVINAAAGTQRQGNPIAAFDLDHTLIRPASGCKFPKSTSDWKFAYSTVKDVLRGFHEKGYTLCVISNQGGRDGEDLVGFSQKLNAIAESLGGIPVSFYVSAAYDSYRKPGIGFWKMICERFVPAGGSFYCGDAAGRPGDFSDSDLRFALNAGIEFKTPEAVFAGVETHVSLVPTGFDPRTYVPPFAYPQDALARIADGSPSVVVLVGLPGSGKSTFAARVFDKFVAINQDTLKTVPKCKKACKEALAMGRSTIIDNTNVTAKARGEYIALARGAGVPVYAVWLTTEKQVAEHNVAVRVARGGRHVPRVAMATITARKESDGRSIAHTFGYFLGQRVHSSRLTTHGIFLSPFAAEMQVKSFVAKVSRTNAAR